MALPWVFKSQAGGYLLLAKEKLSGALNFGLRDVH